MYINSINHSKDAQVQACVERLVSESFIERLKEKDINLWGAAAAAEAENRLGWMDFQKTLTSVLTTAAEKRAELNSSDINEIVLCGMGGSSLAPELISEWANVPLTVLDSTHPAQVAAVFERDLSRTAVIFSSKSGGTLETRTLLEVAESAFKASNISSAERILVITDPGSELAEIAEEKHYTVFYGSESVGGRFSALTAFGLVPPVIAGAELNPLLQPAEAAIEICLQNSAENPALQLAAVLYTQSPKYLFEIYAATPEIELLGDWVEQLIAESTGKDGKGLLPVGIHGSEHDYALRNTAENSAAFSIALREFAGDFAPSECDFTLTAELGEQLIIWQIATAALGYLLQVNPFDQPHVELSKNAAQNILAAKDNSTGIKKQVFTDADSFTYYPELCAEQFSNTSELQQVLTGSLQSSERALVVNIYTARNAESTAVVAELQRRLMAKFNVPVAVSFGPRYLHSTGQFHKGGVDGPIFIQLIDESACALTPANLTESCYTQLSRINISQALGDAQALQNQLRKVITVGFTCAVDKLTNLFRL